ncbi:hypothetical protein CLIB1423_05S00672 [[Candida] railenensis]|uniref:GATA-type domain-containing protein n=1 Tax=[Candida] railenensis TaxID=45579 RepID=A0A9P0QNA4_9ASCO|nr:hypothetical protein CLIB1423_05S00672 [[Candida] railenensis]
MSNPKRSIQLPPFNVVFSEFRSDASPILKHKPSYQYFTPLDVLASVGSNIQLLHKYPEVDSTLSEVQEIVIDSSESDQTETGTEINHNCEETILSYIFKLIFKLELLVQTLTQWKEQLGANSQVQPIWNQENSLDVSIINGAVSNENFCSSKSGSQTTASLSNIYSELSNLNKQIHTLIKENIQLSLVEEIAGLSSSAAENEKKCKHCLCSNTPEWRKGPDGTRTLCNACGLFFSKLYKKFGIQRAIEIMNERKSNGDYLDRKIPS